MAEKSERPRRSRFKRQTKAHRKPFVLRERDVLIARYVHKYRYLNSHHIRALIPGNDVNVGLKSNNDVGAIASV